MVALAAVSPNWLRLVRKVSWCSSAVNSVNTYVVDSDRPGAERSGVVCDGDESRVKADLASSSCLRKRGAGLGEGTGGYSMVLLTELKGYCVANLSGDICRLVE